MLTDRSETNCVFADQEEVTGPGWHDTAELRWKRFLLHASRWKERSLGHGDPS
jgi:hypothetical protein